MLEKDLTLLGKKVVQPKSPDEAKLETFDNRNPENNYLIPMDCLEFTTLCPITNQPDFATFEIVYAPAKKCIESKSLKLYLHSYRNIGMFHEFVTNKIFDDLWKVLKPKYMRVFGEFNVRGGIAIKPLVEKYAPRLSKKDREEVMSLLVSWDRKS